MNRPLRVLTIGHSYVVAMNRAVARNISVDSDFEITVAAPKYFNGDLRPLRLEAEPAGSRIRLTPLKAKLTKLIHIFRYDQTALRRLVDADFDVVHAWEEPYIFAGYQIATSLKNSNSRFCFRTAQSYLKRYPPPFGLFERTVLRRAQGWIAGASLVHRAMLERQYPPQSGRILNLAVDLDAFSPLSDAQRQAVLDELDLRPPVIGFVGRLTRAKGIHVLLKALDQLRDRPWSALFLGSGECRKEIQEWAESRQLSRRVKVMLATHSEVPRYLGAMDLLAAPSQTTSNWREQFGRMIIEAFACGVPVIGSNSGEIPYVIGDAGRIVGESDVDGLCGNIRDLLDSEDARRKLSKLGLARAKTFSVESSAGKYKEYYRWLADQPLN